MGKKFMEAEEACNRLSETPGKIIHLASIHSDDEFYALRDLIPQVIKLFVCCLNRSVLFYYIFSTVTDYRVLFAVHVCSLIGYGL